ncbi:Ionotropic receptor 233 [Frankliniella occidentalis]|nr:Ionotropic receptor 233 [Frankliniella occidentalis]
MVLLLALVVAGAHAALVHHSLERLGALNSSPTEVASSVSLVARILAPRNGNLFVYYEHQQWLGAFIRQLPSETPRALIGVRALRNSDELPGSWLGLNEHVDMTLLARSDPKVLLTTLVTVRQFFSPFSRILLVTTAASNQTARNIIYSNWWCDANVAVVVGYPDGTAELLRVRSKSSACWAKIEGVDSWSQSLGRWEVGVNPFFAWCFGHSPHRTNPPSMLVETSVVNPSRFRRALEVARLVGLEVVNTSKVKNEEAKLCRADALSYGLPIAAAQPVEVDGFFTTTLSAGVLAVPAGMGAPRRSLVAEYPPALCCLTALAVLGVSAALAHSPAEAPTLLRALAPLLSQPPPGRPTRQPLLLAWLLVCVVLAAAYQGLLLKMLTRRVRGNVDSVEEFLLQQNGLPIRASFDMYHLKCVKYRELPMNISIVKTRFLLHAVMDAAFNRNLSVFTQRNLIPLWLLETERLHLIPAEQQAVRSQFFLPRRSPLAERFRLALARISGAGLVKHWEIWEDREYRRLKMSEDRREPVALDVRTVVSALAVLGGGLGMAVVALVAEVAARGLSHRHVDGDVGTSSVDVLRPRRRRGSPSWRWTQWRPPLSSGAAAARSLGRSTPLLASPLCRSDRLVKSV